jgi:uncharacterized protein YqeY
MSLKEQITEDMKTAMRAKDAERLGTVRLLLSAMKQKEKLSTASWAIACCERACNGA